MLKTLLDSTLIGSMALKNRFVSAAVHYEKDFSKRTRCVSCNACLNPENAGSCILNQNV